MKTNMFFGFGALVLLVSMPVAKGWGWSQPDFGSEKYAQRLADIAVKEGVEKLKQVIEQEVPAQQREKISLELVAMFVGQAILPPCPVKLSAKDKEEIWARAESLQLLLIKMGCGSMQERKKIADGIVGVFELHGNEVFVKAEDVDAGESYEDLLHRKCKVVF